MVMTGRPWVLAIGAVLLAAVETHAQGSGADIYAVTCAVCHGEDGSGAMWGRTSLKPAPVDFTAVDPVRDLPRARMIASVANGRAGTAMTPFDSQLSIEQIHAVVDYIRAAFMRQRAPAPTATTVGAAVLQGATAVAPSVPVTTRELVDVPMPYGLSGDSIRGAELYTLGCTPCHGEAGDGNGPRAYFIFPKPRNFVAAAARLNRVSLFTAIKHGVPGREMPAWGKVLKDQQIADLVVYVYTEFVDTMTSGDADE